MNEPKTEIVYLTFGRNVHLSQRQYDKLLDVFAYTGNPEYYRELAINILDNDKAGDAKRERKRYTNEEPNSNKDMKRILSWVKATVDNKYQAKLEKEAQQNTTHMTQTEHDDNDITEKQEKQETLTNEDISVFVPILDKTGVWKEAIHLTNVTKDTVFIQMPGIESYRTFCSDFNGSDFFDTVKSAYKRKVRLNFKNQLHRDIYV